MNLNNKNTDMRRLAQYDALISRKGVCQRYKHKHKQQVLSHIVGRVGECVKGRAALRDGTDL